MVVSRERGSLVLVVQEDGLGEFSREDIGEQGWQVGREELVGAAPRELDEIDMCKGLGTSAASSSRTAPGPASQGTRSVGIGRGPVRGLRRHGRQSRVNCEV